MYYTVMNTHMCEIILVGDEEGLSHLHLDTNEGKRVFEIDQEWIENPAFFEKAIRQIEEYFEGKREVFELKLNPKGTDYQKKVWGELSRIPFNELRTYKDIAINIGNEKASRAVGMANSKNPIPLIVPCHRVVGANGSLTGFAHGTQIKEKLIHFEKITNIYNRLLEAYGEQHWWPAESDYEIMIGAVLTQNTNWANVEKAITNLVNVNKLNPTKLLETSNEELAELIKPSGYYNQKAIKLKAITNWFKEYEFDIEKARLVDGDKLRGELLEVHGVGPETADDILVYALKKPFFVIDTYTRRLFKRLGFDVPKNYDEFRMMIEEAIGKNIDMYGEFHGLIVMHAKEHCQKIPKCEGCPLAYICLEQL